MNETLKTVLILLAIAFVGFLLAGIVLHIATGGDEHEGHDHAPGEHHDEQESAIDPEAEYVDFLDSYDMAPSGSEKSAIGVGREICNAFDAGAALSDVGMALMGSGLTPEESARFTFAAVTFFCPEYTHRLETT